MKPGFLSLILCFTASRVLATGDCPCGKNTTSSCTIDNPGGGGGGGSGTSNQYVKMTGGTSSQVITLHPGTNRVPIPAEFGRNADGTVTFTIVADASGTALPTNSQTYLDLYPEGSPIYYGPLPTSIAWGDGHRNHGHRDRKFHCHCHGRQRPHIGLPGLHFNTGGEVNSSRGRYSPGPRR